MLIFLQLKSQLLSFRCAITFLSLLRINAFHKVNIKNLSTVTQINYVTSDITAESRDGAMSRSCNWRLHIGRKSRTCFLHSIDKFSPEKYF